MNIVDPSVEIWKKESPNQHIARCARVCYASDKTTNNDNMVARLIERGHLSMLRHNSYYYIVPAERFGAFKNFGVGQCPYIRYIKKRKAEFFYVSTNGQFIHENPKIAEFLSEYYVDESEFFKHEDALSLFRVTVFLSTQIAIASELNRVGPQNISQQSTRYVDLYKKGIPLSKAHWMGRFSGWKKIVENLLLRVCTLPYTIARKVLKLPPEDARYFLPLGTETKVAYTYTVQEWEHILDLRLRGTTGKPHPDAKAIAEIIEKELDKYLPTYSD